MDNMNKLNITILQNLTSLFVDTEEKWVLWKSYFGNPEVAHSLFNIDDLIAHHIEESLLTSIVLSIAALTDAKSHGKDENISFNQFTEIQDISDQITTLNKLAYPLKAIRHKSIAHYDRRCFVTSEFPKLGVSIHEIDNMLGIMKSVLSRLGATGIQPDRLPEIAARTQKTLSKLSLYHERQGYKHER